MTSDFIVISSDDELVSNLNTKNSIQVICPSNLDVEDVVYISSADDDDLFIPKRIMKSDTDELPRINFPSREARLHRHRHQHRKRSNENNDKSSKKRSASRSNSGETPNSSKEPPRIPPLPDLSMFVSEKPQVDNSASDKRPKSSTKRSGSIKKKRHSIEAIKSKEREILGDLFVPDKKKEVRRKLHLKEQHSKKVQSESTTSFKVISVDSDVDKVCNENNDLKRNDSLGKTDHENDKASRSKHTSGDCSNKGEQSSRSRHSSDKSTDGETRSKEKECKKLHLDINAASAQLRKQIKQSLSIKEEKTLEDSCEHGKIEVKSGSNVPVVIDVRDKTDHSDMCHHINCSKTASSGLLNALDKKYKKELENILISPRSRESVQNVMIPVVELHTARPPPAFVRKSISVESSESESETDRTRRHFMDVFSDISEAESDNSIKTNDSLNKVVPDKANKSTHFSNQKSKYTDNEDEEINVISVKKENDKNANETLPIKVCQNLKYLPINPKPDTTKFNKGNDAHFKRKNYRVMLDEFSDISEEDEAQTDKHNKYYLPESSESDAFINTPLGGNDYLGNSTLTGTDVEETIVNVTNETAESVSTIETEMPVLDNLFMNKSKCSAQSFEMPILEKYTEVYSSFRTELDEQDVLPDIEDDEMEVIETDPIIARRQLDKSTTQSSEIHDKKLFSKFSLIRERSCIKSALGTVSSISSSVSPSAQSGLKTSKSDFLLSSPKECSTPKSRKRKIRKSNTCLSLGSLTDSYSRFSPCSTSSHIEKLSMTKQMDQLTDYLNEFLCLNDSKVFLPKLPEAQKNIVYGCEEEGTLNLGHALNFIEHFCWKYVIPRDLCNDLIKSAFHSDCKLSHIHWTYNLLSELNMRRTVEIEVCWETMESCLNTALSANKEKPYYQLLQATLLLQLGVDVLKMDLYSKELSDNREIRKSFAYKMFAYDVSSGNRKRLVYFLNQALHAGQCRTGSEGEVFRLPDVLPMLQDLFALCVDVSSSCVDCANTLATDMVNTYKFLPNLADKLLLIKSVSSQLLQYKLVQYVLESQYDCYQVLGSAFPDSLEDIVQCFFKVMPLKNPLTPPTTPNEDVAMEEDGFFNVFSPEVSEEIAFLLYFVVVSYLQASSDKLYTALRLRVNLPKEKKRLRRDDIEELGKLHEHASDLEHHLRCMTPDLTENTEHYLFLMRCLGDLGQEQHE